MGVQGLLSTALEELLVVQVPVSCVFLALVQPGAQRRRGEGNGVESDCSIQKKPRHSATPEDPSGLLRHGFGPSIKSNIFVDTFIAIWMCDHVIHTQPLPGVSILLRWPHLADHEECSLHLLCLPSDMVPPPSL